MIQDIFPDILYNEFRAQQKPSEQSPVLCYRGQEVLAKVAQKQGTPLLQFPTAGQIRQKPDAGTLVYAFAVNETAYFLEIWSGVDNTPKGADVSRPVSTPESSQGSTGVPDVPLAEEGYEYLDIRQLRRNLPNVYGMIVFTGYHLHMWYQGRRYCGYCGSSLIHDNKERAVYCPCCGQKNYPRIMPAVIVGVISKDRLLVTKYKEGYRYYALIAGFTEIGETLEETVSREVMEETGLRVKNIRYYKSQPWGIAGDILAGFYCDVDGDTAITLDANELKVAEWKRGDEIELQPDSFSLTNEMMRRFKEGKKC